MPQDGDKFVIPDDHDLIIDKIDLEEAGKYVCASSSGHNHVIYQVDVINKENTRTVCTVNTNKAEDILI